jgi:hypothetical protein
VSKDHRADREDGSTDPNRDGGLVFRKVRRNNAITRCDGLVPCLLSFLSEQLFIQHKFQTF